MTLTMMRPPVAGDLPGNVLIVGVNYWPEVTGNAPYTTGLAEHLAARGSRVTVLTGMPYYPQWRVHEGYRGRLRLRETVAGVDVRHFRQYVPGRQSAVRRALFEGDLSRHTLPFLRVPRPDVVLGVLPNLAGGLLAATAARRYAAPLGLLFQDLTGQGQGRAASPAVGAWHGRRGRSKGASPAAPTRSPSSPRVSAPASSNWGWTRRAFIGYGIGPMSAARYARRSRCARGWDCPPAPGSACTPATWASSRGWRTSSPPPASPRVSRTRRCSC
ncbi:MAG: glycosyltransferase [Dehalococcoidia bacterium]